MRNSHYYDFRQIHNATHKKVFFKVNSRVRDLENYSKTHTQSFGYIWDMIGPQVGEQIWRQIKTQTVIKESI